MKKICLTLLLITIHAAFSYGIIKGTVISLDSLVLTEANITIIGTSLGSATDETGKFVIKGVGEGTYILKCSHIGYSDDFARGVEVKRDAVTEVAFILEPMEYQLQAIEVDKQMDDFESLLKTRNLSTTELFVHQSVMMPKPKGKIRIDTRVGFWERFRHFFHKMFN
ncbi:MAG: carboxypeptidase-like regulatory domain-containing protein [Candidatus Delongbacteria bacterium]|nr:carboxypeptidase-like regulatory domain-containing protein [Candidatus Delongbacteria bacterium]